MDHYFRKEVGSENNSTFLIDGLPSAKQYTIGKRFHSKMAKYLEEHVEHLLLTKSDGIAVSHNAVIKEFLSFLFNEHLISDLSQITVSMVNSKFHSRYKSINKAGLSTGSIKAVQKEFFTFLDGKYGIKNTKLMNAFEQKEKL
jgi:hypothetical protein